MAHRFPRASRAPRLRISNEEFEALVEKALDSLPESFSSLLDNVFVTIEEEPTEEDLDLLPQSEASEPPSGRAEDSEVFGIYHGIPLTERDSFYGSALPDRIVLFRGPLLRACRSRREAIDEITKTVLHELGHHFGMDEDRMPY